MTLSTPQRVGIFAILAIVMAATRVNHFAALPDASWAVFFVAGFYLSAGPSAKDRASLRGLFNFRGSVRWAFPLLIALAVLIDFIVITGQGMNFWSHYCVSIAYWFLLPAYLSLWLAGSWLRSRYAGLGLRELGFLAASLFAAVSVCYVLSNGSYYWLSDSWLTAGSTRSFGGWLENLGDWYVPYLRTSAMYVGIAAVLHVGVTLVARTLDGSASAASARSLRG